MHFGFSVLVTLVAVILVLATGASGNRQPVYVAALLGAIGAIGLPIKGEDGVNIVLCWVFLLASGVAVSLARHKSSPALSGAQAQAVGFEAGAKRGLADEYDAAQQRGEVAKRPDGAAVRDRAPDRSMVASATVTDLSLTRKQIHKACEIRDADDAEPGIVRRILDDTVQSGEEPMKAKRRGAIKEKRKRRRSAIL
jgi:hypothetical protein